MMDVVYVLGTGSKWSDNELRFSLRSLEKNLSGFRNIYVVGEKPSFLHNVIHIPYPDELGPNNADGNIIRKVLRACREKDLSETFVFINDDHLINAEMSVDEIHPYHVGDLKAFPDSYFSLNPWRERVRRTRDVLAEKGYTTLHFDIHAPILFSKTLFPKVIQKFNYAEGIGYTMKSLYGNVVYPDGPYLHGEKQKIFTSYTLQQIVTKVQMANFVAFNDDGLNKSFKYWLYETYPQQSTYEKNQAQDPVFEIFEWKEGGEDYNEGVALFNKYGKIRNLKRMFSNNYSPGLEKKLRYKLKKMLYD